MTELTMSFMPNTIEHLGARLYSTVPPIVSELISNAYDAYATKVTIDLIDEKADKKIIVSDDGIGMSQDEINTKFLLIGRNRRNDSQEVKTDDEALKKRIANRKVVGKKGLGKLSFFGIANTITIKTIQNEKCNEFRLSLNEILKTPSKEGEIPAYHPHIIQDDVNTNEKDGTTITLEEIKRTSDFKSKDLATSLSKIFILSNDFAITVSHNGKESVPVSNELRYQDLDEEFSWDLPGAITKDIDYAQKEKVIGKIFTTKKPIPKNVNMNGITLFSRGKLVNEPDYFAESTSSHFYSYTSGTVSVDFIDDLEDDVIDTNRQHLNWNNGEIEELRNYLQKVVKAIQADWREKRKVAQEKKIKEKTSINIAEWTSKMPEEITKQASPVISRLTGNSELPESVDDASNALLAFHELIPEYPNYHWRHLHPTLSQIVRPYYESNDFYTAVFEGVKKYICEAKNKTGSTITDRNLLEQIWSTSSPKLSVTNNYSKPDGNDFDSVTIQSITEGHKALVIAMWQAFRCPIAHELVADLRQSGLYTEKDCLDALSLLSHLFRRLDSAVSVQIQENENIND